MWRSAQSQIYYSAICVVATARQMPRGGVHLCRPSSLVDVLARSVSAYSFRPCGGRLVPISAFILFRPVRSSSLGKPAHRSRSRSSHGGIEQHPPVSAVQFREQSVNLPRAGYLTFAWSWETRWRCTSRHYFSPCLGKYERVRLVSCVAVAVECKNRRSDAK